MVPGPAGQSGLYGATGKIKLKRNARCAIVEKTDERIRALRTAQKMRKGRALFACKKGRNKNV
jgi:hypothetical protein